MNPRGPEAHRLSRPAPYHCPPPHGALGDPGTNKNEDKPNI